MFHPIRTFTEAAFGPGALGRHSQLRAGRASAELGQRGAGLRHAAGHGAASHGESGQRGDAAGAPHWEPLGGGEGVEGVAGNTTHFWDVLLEGSVRGMSCISRFTRYDRNQTTPICLVGQKLRFSNWRDGTVPGCMKHRRNKGGIKAKNHTIRKS